MRPAPLRATPRRSSPSFGKKDWWRTETMSAAASAEAFATEASTPAHAESAELAAPLYIAWQVTNECNLACLHCIEESGPGKAFRDELGKEEVFRFLEHAMDLEI